MSQQVEYHFMARSIAKSLILIGLISLVFALIQVEKDNAGNVRVWIGISEMYLGQIFFALCVGEIVIGILNRIQATPIGVFAGFFMFFLGGLWNILMGVLATSSEVQLKMASPLFCFVMGGIMIIMAIRGVRDILSLQRDARLAKKRYEGLDFRAMLEREMLPEEYAKLVKEADELTQANPLPADHWRKRYESVMAAGAKFLRPEEPKQEPAGLRQIPGYGRLTPSQYAMLELAGYNLDATRFGANSGNPAQEYVADLDRISIIKRGRTQLTDLTGVDHGYDLAAWHAWFETHPEHHFDHHYAAMNTRKLIERAQADPDRQRLVSELASDGV